MNIRELRHERGWTLAGLEAVSGVSVSQLSKIERGKEGASNATYQKIAAALGVNWWEIALGPESDAAAPKP